MPGWADNFNGPTGMLVACGVGILRSQNCDPYIVADFVPADLVVRGLIIAAYERLIQPEAPKPADPIRVFNCATANISPITMGQVIEIGKRRIRQNPFEKTLWLPGGCITLCPVLHFVRVSSTKGGRRRRGRKRDRTILIFNFLQFITMHIMMAIVVDTVLRLSNEKPL